MLPFPIAAVTLLVVTALASLGAHAQAATGTTARASNVQIQRNILGSGSPGEESGGYENAERVVNDLYHVPQYLPGTPTAATLWPRVVEVPCVRGPAGETLCQGYEWGPNLGRAEYLFFRPLLVAAPGAGADVAPPASRNRPDGN